MIKERQIRAAVFSTGLLFSRPLRRVVASCGYKLVLPLPVFARVIAVWGRIPRSRKVIAQYAKKRDIVTFEDALLRSVLPGLSSPPIGVSVDRSGVYFDSTRPSDLEDILCVNPLNSAELLKRARDGRAFLKRYGLSKYNPVARGGGKVPGRGYVLVVDQVAGDASIVGAGADAARFAEMLACAKAENPNRQVIIRAHPAKRNGHFPNESKGVSSWRFSANPWDMLESAHKVYCVSSQMGFDAILAGHKPVVFGVPFYAGWGLTDDRYQVPRRGRNLSTDQLFAGVMLLYPFWYDHLRREACSFETASRQLLAEAQHHWETQTPTVAYGMRLWKRRTVAQFLGPVTFEKSAEKAVARCQRYNRKLVVWAGSADEITAPDVKTYKMEDGFIRSKGLGAELVPASSLVIDDLGIYYDPSKPSRLEVLISEAPDLPKFALKRAADLRAEVVAAGISKYNLPSKEADWQGNKRVLLVPGQVEDDASILAGAGIVCTNLALLAETRSANPEAYIVYKPHPDVVAGLRKGAVNTREALKYCDNISTVISLDNCAEVWTMTSLMGFEALLRGKAVTCFGTPFYAGWGLTDDRGPPVSRRSVQVPLDGLVHAALIDYPRYVDPKTGRACTPELLIERFQNGTVQRIPMLRVLSKLQGILASYAFIWR